MSRKQEGVYTKVAMVKDRVFLDSSVLIAAVFSSSGGSFYILNKFKNKFEFQINEYVLEELMRISDQKFSAIADLKSRLFLLFGWAGVKILQDPSRKQIKVLAKFINKEDAPILASALTHSSFLLTLDNDFLTDSVIKFAKTKGLVIVRPKEFIQAAKTGNE